MATVAHETETVDAATLDSADEAGNLLVCDLGTGESHRWAVCDLAGHVLEVFRTQDAAHAYAHAVQDRVNWHTTDPTPIEVLAEQEPLDLDAIDPASMVDYDALYHDRYAEEAIFFGGFGHPAQEEW